MLLHWKPSIISVGSLRKRMNSNRKVGRSLRVLDVSGSFNIVHPVIQERERAFFRPSTMHLKVRNLFQFLV